MVRRWARASRLTRCIAFLAATAFLLPFTILLLVADQQFKLAYNTKRVFYQENNEMLIRFNTSRTAAVNMASSPASQYALENYTRGEEDERLPPVRYAEVSARMDRRRAHLESECHKARLDGPENTPYTWEYLINKQYHVIWCNIFKAASSSWMYNFNLMANYSASFLDKTKEVPLELARKRYSRPTVDMVRAEQKHAVTFLIVRHPLERLASAYKDKIVHAFPRSFHAKMGDRIIRTYRKDTGSGEKWPSFQEFISYLLDEIRGQRPLDMHWTPYTAFCTPCQFHFEAILKFETLDDDQKYLIQKAKLQDIIKPEWRNRGKGKDTLSKINSYYSMITRSQLDMLYDFYRHDFQLFNYTIDSYYDIVQDG